jgi:hypothetical protein
MAAISGFGTTISFDSVNIGEVISLSADGMKLSTIDVTNITQRHRVFVPGIIDSGTIGVEVNYDDTPSSGQVNMIKQMDITAATPATAPAAKAIVFTCGNANNKGFTLSGNAIVTDFSTKIGIDSAGTASFNLKWTGAVTFADVA